MISKNLQKLKIPDKPGIYFFKKGREILYIGKATSLRDRIKSYFSKDLIATRGPIVLDMAFKADKIDWQTTDSVLEAIILEANLIKKYQPKYNSKEKSDKSFNYVCITKESLPKVIIVRGRNLKNYKGVFFGPYPNGSQLKEALHIIRKIFPFIDATSSKKNNQEFYKQINLNPETLEGYLRDIKNLKLFFEGKKKRILQNLNKEMKEYAKKHEFEKAGEVKRQIFALQHINDVALLKNGTTSYENSSRFTRQNPTGSDTDKNFHNSLFRIEAYDIAHMGGKNMVGVMTVVENGEVAKYEYKKFKIRTQNNANDTGALKEVLERRLVHTEWTYPNLIVVDGGVAQLNAAKKILFKLNLNISLVSVLKDERHKPKNILGNKEFSVKYEREILLANSEAHRFAIAYHKNMRNKNFLK